VNKSILFVQNFVTSVKWYENDDKIIIIIIIIIIEAICRFL